MSMKPIGRFEALYDDGTAVWIEQWSAVEDTGGLDEARTDDKPGELRLPGGGALNRNPDGSFTEVSTGKRLRAR